MADGSNDNNDPKDDDEAKKAKDASDSGKGEAGKDGAKGANAAKNSHNDDDHEHGEHCDHDHDHDHDHKHGHNHSHDNDGKAAKKKKFTFKDFKEGVKNFSLRKAFRNASNYVKTNKLEALALFGSLLLGSTALTTPILDSLVGAGVLLGASIYTMLKTTDITLDNLSNFGNKIGMSAVVLGLIIGGLNTVPEIMVSMGALFQGSSAMAIGNVVGSNMAHILLILGATAAAASGGIAGLKKGMSNKFNMAVLGGATAGFGGMLITGSMIPIVGAAMLGLAGYFLVKRMRTGKDGEDVSFEDLEGCETGQCLFHDHGGDGEGGHGTDVEELKKRPAWLSAILGIAGFAGLVFSADALVSSGVNIAQSGIGISEALVGAVAIAIGTSLPELMINIKAAMKKATDLAMGNIIGCSIFNIAIAGGILGLTGVDIPAAFSTSTLLGALNIGAFVGSTGLLATALLAGRGKIGKKFGIAALGAYGAYIVASVILNGGDFSHLHMDDIAHIAGESFDLDKLTNIDLSSIFSGGDGGTAALPGSIDGINGTEAVDVGDVSGAADAGNYNIDQGQGQGFEQKLANRKASNFTPS